jgi:pyrroline-5-carboxylate reductase
MGAALAAGYAAAANGVEVAAVDREPAHARTLLGDGSRVALYPSPQSVAGGEPDVVVIALKPQALEAALPEFASLCRPALVVSIAAGVTVAGLQRLLGGHDRIVRAMPNLPVVAKSGMTVLHAGTGRVSARDREWAGGIFAAVGKIAWVEDERQIDIATAIAGSGPAYHYAMVEQMAQAARALGCADELAELLSSQTFIGAARLLESDARTAGALKAAVRSPGGTTQAGLAVLEERNALARLIEATVAAALARARELGSA